jgi:hypothetical protein
VSGTWCRTPSEYPKSIDASSNGSVSTLAWWNSQFVYLRSVSRATASAAALAWTQCRVPESDVVVWNLVPREDGEVLR